MKVAHYNNSNSYSYSYSSNNKQCHKDMLLFLMWMWTCRMMFLKSPWLLKFNPFQDRHHLFEVTLGDLVVRQEVHVVHPMMIQDPWMLLPEVTREQLQMIWLVFEEGERN